MQWGHTDCFSDATIKRKLLKKQPKKRDPLARSGSYVHPFLAGDFKKSCESAWKYSSAMVVLGFLTVSRRWKRWRTFSLACIKWYVVRSSPSRRAKFPSDDTKTEQNVLWWLLFCIKTSNNMMVHSSKCTFLIWFSECSVFNFYCGPPPLL